MSSDTLSTRHQWFTHVRLPGPYLTHSRAPFPQRSPPRLLTDAACGGLKPPPAGRLRRAHLHLWCSQLPSGPIFYILIPGTAWAVRQVLSQTDPEVTTRLGFDAVDTLSTRHQWFTHVRLPGSYLTHYSCALSVTLTTPALDRRSVRWFDASACTAASEGPPSISGAASFRQVRPSTSSPPSAFVAHSRPRSASAPRSLGRSS